MKPIDWSNRIKPYSNHNLVLLKIEFRTETTQENKTQNNNQNRIERIKGQILKNDLK